MTADVPPRGSRLALELLKPNLVPVSRAVVRQLKTTVPRYKDVDAIAMEKNVGMILKGLVRLIEKGDIATLKNITAEIVQLRTTSGFGVDELITAGFCFLPVLRRLYTEYADDIGRGLDAYEHVESMALPMFGFVASHASDLDEITDPRASAWQALAFPASIESLEEDEVTQPRSRPRRRS